VTWGDIPEGMSPAGKGLHCLLSEGPEDMGDMDRHPALVHVRVCVYR
jgi:hypothetical protein